MGFWPQGERNLFALCDLSIRGSREMAFEVFKTGSTPFLTLSIPAQDVVGRILINVSDSLMDSCLDGQWKLEKCCKLVSFQCSVLS